ncbi:MAG TPA: V-type ATP synthase subunit D [Cellulomonas sp.]|uniref:V-type ATP synthase subunit D n=1 Tax=Cellulomonas sp. TaxID=40001 RepID=UPI002E3596CE|nr:V-type ATP synthase subunit D [Cellulomonas sp.]HEX5332253.1 V-type ATP synthase subunit D [Cellulomonas sp.]
MNDTGRAGRMRVERRLRTARHGADLLDRKRQIMADELERLQLHEGRLRDEWETCARVASVWLQRTTALDGQAGIRSAAPAEAAQVEVAWDSAMGVAYPVDASCTAPQPSRPGGSSALSYATAAHRAAASAAVRLAAVQRAVVLVSAELAATHARQRAVENRWIPRLEEQLRTIRRRLDSQELEEALRLRWAAEPTRTGVS